ncbi:MAG: YqcC family protein [Psychromonas sp.]
MQKNEQKKRQLLNSLLNELEAALRQQKLWQSERPTEQALSSSEPFAIDYLNFSQWLQFIFIEKITRLLQLNLALPNAMAITPMASEYFKRPRHHCPEIVALIRRIDVTMNEKK